MHYKLSLLLFLSLLCTCVRAQVTSNATAGSGSGYPALTASGFEIEDPDCVHTDFGPHVTQAFDAELDRNVFVFHSHIEEDNDRCLVFDRVRMEIKGSSSTIPELRHNRGDTTYYRWKFRLDEDFIGASSFCHLYQNKAVGGDDTSFPIITITARANRVEVLHNGGDSGANLGTLAQADIGRFRGRWVEGYLRQVHDEDGELEITLRDMATGLTILEYTNGNIDLWRAGATLNRPKWGVYRSKNSVLRDEDVRFANFCVSEQAEALCPAEAVLVPDTDAPTVPDGLAVTGTTFTTVSLNWQASADEYGVSAYVIYADGDSVATTPSTGAVISDLATATTYSFTVAARDAAGNESARSAAVTATTDDANALPGPATNPTPADGATDVRPRSGLSWTAGDNTDSYEVFFGTDPDPASVGTQTANNYQPDMAANVTYYWRIAATNQNGTVSGPVWSFTTGSLTDDLPWYVFRGNARPEVETDFFELNNAPATPALDVILDDPDFPGNNIFGYRSDGDNFKWRFRLGTQDSTLTIVTRIRGIDADASGMMHVDIRAFGYREKVRFNSSSVKLERADPQVEAELPFDWDAGYHTVRIVMDGQRTTVYLDESETPFLTGVTEEESPSTYVEWGKIGGEDYGAFVDWMAINITEASAPGTGTDLPEDLFPTVSDAPWTVYRADARPEVETDFYELNTSPEVPLLDEIIQDPNGSGNTYYGFRSDSDNFRWRYRFGNEDSTLTIVARLKAADPDLNGIIYFETRAFGWRQKVRINQSTIKLERTDNEAEAETPFNWNDELHVVRFVISGPTMTVYLDENPEPFLTGTSNEATTSDYFEWGKSGGDDYGAIVDWIAVNRSELSAPGQGTPLPEDLFISSDATLAFLTVDGVEIDTFLPYRTEYTVPVDFGLPELAFTTTSDFAETTLDPAGMPNDTTFITVTAEDGLTTRTYTVIFEQVLSTFDAGLQSTIGVYPNPTTGNVTLTLPEQGNFTVTAYGLDGRQLLASRPALNGQRLDLSALNQGAYFLMIRAESGKLARLQVVVR